MVVGSLLIPRSLRAGIPARDRSLGTAYVRSAPFGRPNFLSEQRGAAQAALQMVLEAADREALGLSGNSARHLGERDAQLATEDATDGGEGLGPDPAAREPPARP